RWDADLIETRWAEGRAGARRGFEDIARNQLPVDDLSIPARRPAYGGQVASCGAHGVDLNGHFASARHGRRDDDLFHRVGTDDGDVRFQAVGETVVGFVVDYALVSAGVVEELDATARLGAHAAEVETDDRARFVTLTGDHLSRRARREADRIYAGIADSLPVKCNVHLLEKLARRWDINIGDPAVSDDEDLEFVFLRTSNTAVVVQRDCPLAGRGVGADVQFDFHAAGSQAEFRRDEKIPGNAR